MRTTVAISLATVLGLNPSLLFAGNQFVIVDSVRSSDGAQIVTSLIAGNQLSAGENGIISIAGSILPVSGEPMEITVNIETDGRQVAPSVFEYAESTGRISIINYYEYSTSNFGSEINRVIYSIRIPDDNSVGTIAITDEPLPAVVGWLAFAGIAALTGLTVYGMDVCTKLSLSISADIAATKGETTITCEKN